MSFTINYRVLMFFFGIVMLLNCGNFLLTFKKHDYRRRLNPRFPIVLFNENNNDSQKSSDYGASLENETCAVTYVEEPTELCPELPPNLGVEKPTLSGELRELRLTMKIGLGGHTKNEKCIARQQIAIIVPYRGLVKQLHVFMCHMHRFLTKQQADYQIFVVEYGNKTIPYNRGQLFNIGVAEAQKHRNGWQCLIFHDPHLLPTDSRNLYRCSWYPRQLVTVVNIDPGKFTKPSIGGALAVSPESFAKLNGFSNQLLGRDADYMDFQQRMKWANMTLERSDSIFGSYRSYGPVPDMNNTFYSVVVTPFHLLDGLTSLSYVLEGIEFGVFYTHIIVGDISVQKSGKKIDELLEQVILNKTNEHV